MNTIKDLAIKWWESLDEIYATKLIVKYYPLSVIDYEKIENIFYQEVILKWYVGEYGKVEFDYNEQQIKEIYLKEHTKEQPALDFNYCKNEIEGGNKCYVQCDHCAEYYKPLEMEHQEQPKAIEDNVWDEELINKFFYYLKYDKGVDTLEDSFMNDFKQHYSLIFKEDVWDEFAKEYSQLHSLDLEKVRYWFIPLLEFGKQHYSLIKK